MYSNISVSCPLSLSIDGPSPIDIETSPSTPCIFCFPSKKIAQQIFVRNFFEFFKKFIRNFSTILDRIWLPSNPDQNNQLKIFNLSFLMISGMLYALTKMAVL